MSQSLHLRNRFLKNDKVFAIKGAFFGFTAAELWLWLFDLSTALLPGLGTETFPASPLVAKADNFTVDVGLCSLVIPFLNWKDEQDK